MEEKTPNAVNQDADELLEKVGAKMARIRKELGYTNGYAFAYDREMNPSQYGKYEAGSEDMRFSSLLKTINLLGLTIEDFFAQGLDSNPPEHLPVE